MGLRYEYLPEFSIGTEKRQALATQSVVDALLAEDERDWRPQQGTPWRVLAWLDVGERVAQT